MLEQIIKLLTLYSEKINGIVLSPHEFQDQPTIKTAIIYDIRYCYQGMKTDAQGIYHHQDYAMTSQHAFLLATLNELIEKLKKYIEQIVSIQAKECFFIQNKSPLYQALCELDTTLQDWVVYFNKHLDKEIFAISQPPKRSVTLSVVQPSAPFESGSLRSASLFKLFACGFSADDQDDAEFDDFKRKKY